MTSAGSRRLVSASAVLLLHVGLAIAFLVAMNVRAPQMSSFREIEVSFPQIVEKPRPAMPQPDLIRPAAPAQSVILPEMNAPGIGPPNPGAISGVGRALFGCDPSKLDTLPAEQRAACLRLPPGKPREQSVLMGPVADPNSPFTKEIEERFREATPVNRPCASGSYGDLHGLPCFGFDERSPLLGR
ncbi:MAG TPA: hypothetical protein VGI20_15150 [Rhizomicrobium sp.]|jgi:hypothetical protein